MAVRRPSRSRFVLLLLVLTAGTILTLSYRDQANRYASRVKGWAADVFHPVDRAFADAFRPVGNFFKGAFDYGSLRTENARLRQQVGNLQRQRLETADQSRQLRDLLALSNLPFADGLPRITAEIIDTGFSNFELTVDLDRGSSQGVRAGMPVVAGAGLVGRVVGVAAHTCTVLLLTDATFSVGVRSGNAVGVASGQGRGHALRVDYLPPGSPVHKGDVMVTSGMQGSIFPPGIPVGRVTQSTLPANSLQLDVVLAPVTDPAGLQFVDILRWEPPA